MNVRTFIVFGLTLSLAGKVGAQTYRTEGAALGGLAGAVAGGIIGHQNDETPEGALIGGAIGAIAGGVLGHNRDQQVARDRYYQQQAWNYQQQVRQQRAVSIADVVTMCRGGVGDAVVISHIQSNGVQRRLETHDIISMHQQGVSEAVINAMQHAPMGTNYVTHVVPAPPPAVIVREQYRVVPSYVVPVYPYRNYSFHYGHRHCRY